MFRTILSRTRIAVDTIVLRSSYCSGTSVRIYPPEINDVRLVGTLTSDAFLLPSGTKTLNLKTVKDNNEYQFHSIYTKGFGNLKTGQRLYVSGRLSVSSFKLENGENQNRVTVRAKRIFIMDDEAHKKDSTTITTDLNQIDLAGIIATDVVVNDDHCILIIASQFRNTSNAQNNDVEFSKTDFHTVLVYDNELREFVKSLKVRDRVYVNGEIQTRLHYSSNGKKLSSGFIVAHAAEKLALHKQNLNEHDIEANN